MGEPAENLPEVAQPLELFDESMLPIREDIVEMVEARSFLPVKQPDSARFSGKITIRRMLSNEELCTQVCTAIAIGLGPKLIGKRYQMSPRSVVRVREAMEDRGELAPIGKRIRAQLDRFIELGLERMIEGVFTGEIHAGQLPIPVLAAIDKKGQLDAGVVPGTELALGDVVEANIRAAWAALERARAGASASESDDGTAQAIDITPPATTPGALDTTVDTAPKALPAPTDVLLTVPEAAAVPANGGGGVIGSPAALEPRGATSKILEP